VYLVGRKKLNHWGAVATIIGLPLAILFAWVAQSNAGGDNVRVNSSNQQGGITANTVHINAPPGALQPAPSNRSQMYADKEMLAINLKSLTNGLQNLRQAYEDCKKVASVAQCNGALNAIETNTALRDKICRDNDVPRGNYGCP
jgi:hypothetical protein